MKYGFAVWLKQVFHLKKYAISHLIHIALSEWQSHAYTLKCFKKREEQKILTISKKNFSTIVNN